MAKSHEVTHSSSNKCIREIEMKNKNMGSLYSRFHSSPFTELRHEAEDHLNKFLKQVGGKLEASIGGTVGGK